MGVLSFRLGPVPVRVQASFFLMALLIGWQPGPRWAERLLVWTGIVFVGVLAHEMGHALAALAFGHRPRVELYLFGGVTWWESEQGRRPGQTVLVTLAGPLTGILLGLAAWWLWRGVAPELPPGSSGHFAFSRFVWVNLGWGLLNLLPILPLDGGVVLGTLLERALGDRGRTVVRLASFVLAVAVAVLAAMAGMMFGAAMAGWLAFENARSGLSEWQLRRDAEHAGSIERAIEALGRGDGAALAQIAEALRASAHSLPLRRFGEWLGAWGGLLSGRREEVERWVERHRYDDMRAAALLTGALALQDDKVDAAIDLLGAGVGEPPSPLDVAALRAAFLASGRFDVAVALADSPAGRKLLPEHLLELAEAAGQAGYREAAERLRALAEEAPES